VGLSAKRAGPQLAWPVGLLRVQGTDSASWLAGSRVN